MLPQTFRFPLVFSMRSLHAVFLAMAGILMLSACASVERNFPGVLPKSNLASSHSHKTPASEFLKAHFAAHQQDLDQAATAYAQVALKTPAGSQIDHYAFFYHLAAGDVKSAQSKARSLVKAHQAKDDDAGGQEVVPSLQAIQNGVTIPLLTLAVEALEKKDYKTAIALLDVEVDTVFGRSVGVMMQAWATYEQEGADAALEVFQVDKPDVFKGFFPLHAAMILDLSGETEQARAAYQQALQGFGSESSFAPYAAFIEKNDPPSEVISVYASMAGEYGILRRLGRLGLARLGTPAEGETKAFIRQARKKQSQPISSGADGAAFSLLNFATSAYQQAVQEQAAAYQAGFTRLKPSYNLPLSFAQLAVHLNPKLEEGYYLIGSIYQTYEQHEDALNAFEKVSFHSPYYEISQINIAIELEALGREDIATKSLNAMVEKDPLALEATLSLSDMLLQKEKYEQAETILTRTISRLEESHALSQVTAQGTADKTEKPIANLWRYYFARGAARVQADDFVNGEGDLKKAASLKPEEPLILNYLGYTWAERGENLDEAFAMIEKALTLRPESGAIVDSLGWAHYQLGNYQEALVYLERAVKLEGSDPVITDHLGDVYYRLGRLTEARYEWEYALTLKPDAKLETQLHEKLKTGLSEQPAPLKSNQDPDA